MNEKVQIRKDIGTFAGLCLLYNFVMLLVSILYGIIVQLQQLAYYRGDVEQAMAAAQTILEKDALSYFFSVAIGLFIFWLYRDKKLFTLDLNRKHKQMTPHILGSAIVFLFLAQFLSSLFSLSIEALLNVFGFTLQRAAEAASAGSTTVTMFLYAGFVGPISEELIFRGAGLRAFEKHGKLFAIVMSSILFGLLHANIVQFFFATVIGILLAYITLEYSLWWAIFLHIFNNLMIGDGLIFLQNLLPDGLGEGFLPLLMIGGTVISIYQLWKYRDEMKAYLTEYATPKGSYQQALRSVWFWVFVILMILSSVFLISPLNG